MKVDFVYTIISLLARDCSFALLKMFNVICLPRLENDVGQVIH